MTRVSETRVYAIRANVAVLHDAERVTVLRMDSAEPIPVALGGSARVIWDSINGGRGIEEVVARVAERFSVEPEVIRPDVEQFLAELMSDGFIDCVQVPADSDERDHPAAI